MGEGIVRESGMDMYTPLYLKWITNKDLLCSTWNSAQCYAAAWMGPEFGGECTFSCSIISDYLQPHGLYVGPQAPLFMEFFQARILEQVVISSSRGSS